MPKIKQEIQDNSKNNKTGKTVTRIKAKNIYITYRLHRQGFLTLEIPEIEYWREQL